jgi:hypothetical protein
MKIREEGKPKRTRVLISTYEQFEKLVVSGKYYEFYYDTTLLDGKVVGETSPFDANDPMTFILGRWLFNLPDVRVYQVVEDK